MRRAARPLLAALGLLLLLCAACGPKRSPRSPPPPGGEPAVPAAAPEPTPQPPSPQPAPALPPPAAGRTPLEEPGAPSETAVEAAPLRSPEELRAGVAGFARGRDPARSAAQALQLLATALERADRSGAAADELRRLRGEAAALSRLGPIALDRATRLRAALDQAAAAMERIASSRRATWLAPWAAAAASAVRDVQPRTPLELQLAPVQDALRSLADAALLAWELDDRCAGCPGTAAVPSQTGR